MKELEKVKDIRASVLSEIKSQNHDGEFHYEAPKKSHGPFDFS